MRGAAPTKEERETLNGIGVTLPTPKSARGSKRVYTIDWEDIGEFDLEPECPYCRKKIAFDCDSGSGDIDCPHCGAALDVSWGPLVAEVEFGITLSPKITEADRKYIAWKKGEAA